MKGIVIQNVGATMTIAIEARISSLNIYDAKNCTTVISVGEIPNCYCLSSPLILFITSFTQSAHSRKSLIPC